MDQFRTIDRLWDAVNRARQAQKEIDQILGKAKGNGTTNGATKVQKLAGSKARALQGQYMGAVRGLTKQQFAQVKERRAKAGVAAAITFANKMKQKEA